MAIQVQAGIRVLSGARNLNRLRGKLPLPPDFDSKRYAAKWALKGHGVSAAREEQTIAFANCVVDGWQVFKDSKGKMITRVLGKEAYILMVRPRALQDVVTKIYGNQSRMRVMAEAKGETVDGGKPNDDKGMLANEDLNRAMGKEGVEELQLPTHNINPPKGAGSAKAKSIITKRKIIQ